ncbi:hypothetical protein [Mesomycoplasma dispar]|nr:hypothetical protein [Mesomycoplasma dispar]
MIVNFKNMSLVKNGNSELIKVIQGSSALKFFGLLKREPKDIDLIFFHFNIRSLKFLNQELNAELKNESNLEVGFQIQIFKKIKHTNSGKNIEIILGKFLSPRCYKRISKNLLLVKPEYAVLVKIFQLSVLLSNKFLFSNKFNIEKIAVTINDLKKLLMIKWLFNKTKEFLNKNLINIITNSFVFEFFLKNNVELMWFSINYYQFELINSLEGNKFLSRKIKSLFSLNKYSRNLFNNLMTINEYILKNKYDIINKINSLNKSKNVVSSNEIYLKNVNFFFDNFQIINKQNIVFNSKISTNWNTETIEISKKFPFIKIFKIISLKYKINEKLSVNEILIYSNENQEFLLNTLYKIVVLLTFI